MARHGNWSLILELEGVQRSFTRMIDGVRLLTYRDRLDKLTLTTLLERRVRGDIIEMFKIQEGFVSYGSELFGRAGRTVAARSKPHRFTTNETDFFAQRVLCYWNSLPALVKASESVTSFKSRLDTFRLSGYQANKLGNYWELSYDIFDRIDDSLDNRSNYVKYMNAIQSSCAPRHFLLNKLSKAGGCQVSLSSNILARILVSSTCRIDALEMLLKYI